MNDLNNGIWILQERFQSLSAWETYGVMDGKDISEGGASHWIDERPNARRIAWVPLIQSPACPRHTQASRDRGMLSASQYYANL